MTISRKSFVFFVFLSLLFLTTGTSVRAELADDIAALSAKGFNDKIVAVENLGASGDERVVPVLNALMDGNLYIRKSDKSVVIGTASGKVWILSDPVIEAEIGEAAKSEIEKIRVNNRLRGAISAALGGLNLLSPDPRKRIAAADSVFKSRSAESVSALEKALARETVDEAREHQQMALAAVQAANADEPAVRLKAIETLSAYADPEVRSLLGSIMTTESDETVRAAAEKAKARVEEQLALWATLGNLFQGISLGSVLLLAAVGLAITFGVMGVINMAHGELVMLGAYTTFMVQEIFRHYAPELFDLSLFIAVPAAFLVVGAFGVAIEHGIIRFLYGRPLETLLATWGLSLVLQQFVRTLFGPTNRDVGTPSWMSGYIELTGGLALTYNRIAIVVFSLMVLAALALVLRRTPLGLQMRAVTQNRRMAASMGVRTGRVDALTFGLGSGIAGMAGVALSQIDNVSPNLG